MTSNIKTTQKAAQTMHCIYVGQGPVEYPLEKNDPFMSNSGHKVALYEALTTRNVSGSTLT